MSNTDIKLDADRRRHIVRPEGEPLPGLQVAYGQVVVTGISAQPYKVSFEPPFADAPFVSYADRGGRLVDVTIRNLTAAGFDLYAGGSWTLMPPAGDASDAHVFIDWKAEERALGAGAGAVTPPAGG